MQKRRPPEGAAASPSTATDFLALGDNSTAIPPDTHGAVGTNHVMTVLNSQVRIQNRNGGVISTMALDSFWAPVGGTPDCFDPRLAYDPYSHRWIFTACANSEGPASALLVGVSQSGDPTGNWFLYEFDADADDTDWADYASLGFNKNWIVVSVNLIGVSDGAAHGAEIYAFNKTNLYANGSPIFTKFLSANGSTIAPAVTCDNTSNVEYLLETWNGAAGQLRLSSLAGTPSVPTLTVGLSFPSAGSWGDGGGPDSMPQMGTATKIDGGDSRMQNLVQRNGTLWATHSVFSSNPARAAVQWWQLTTNGAVLQSARIDDPLGDKHFAYPSLAVNANEDVLIGYSRFGATQFVSANYSFRYGLDPINTMRDDTVLKAGEGIYIKKMGTAYNRWGDYSSTVVDPINDVSMWTIQEYAGTPVGTGTLDGDGRWGTWWGRFDSGEESAALVSATLTGEGCQPANGRVDPGENVTVSFTLRNSGGIEITNLVVTLLPGEGVTGPSGPESYGALPVGGANVSRSFSFIAAGACGGMVTARLQLQDGNLILGTVTNAFLMGALNTVFSESFDAVLSPALPAGWASFNSGSGEAWVTTGSSADSEPNALYAPDPSNVSDKHITTPSIPITTTDAQISFRHRYDFEDTYDGGVLEISIGAGPFNDITAGGSIISNGYTDTLDSDFENPIGGRMAWTGLVPNFITSTARLPAAAAGQNIRLRWRATSDSSTSGGGWFVDTVSLLDGLTCCSGSGGPLIVNARHQADGIAFSFASTAGESYDVEYKDSLDVSNWQTLETIVGDGTMKSVTNSLTATNRFFRLRTF